MKPHSRLLATLGLLLVYAVVALGSGQQTPASERRGSIETIDVTSQALAANRLGVSQRQRVAVYVPRRSDNEPRWPVLYLLHGIGGSSADWTAQGPTIQAILDRLIGDGTIPPMLVVMPTAMTPYGGSFYVDSPLSGNWDAFLSRELLTAIDQRFSTDARAERRAVAGHSMGGFGAIELGMRHPDVFGSVYAMSPCCLALEGDLSAQNLVWADMARFTSIEPLIMEVKRGNIYPMSFLALAAALSPNLDRPPFFVDLPFQSDARGVSPYEPAHSRWRARMPVARVAGFAENLRKLHGLWVDYGHRDQYSHIPIGARQLSEALVRAEVPHVIELYSGDHRNRIWERMESRVLPVLARIFRANVQ
jgi:S-formylglutathione hydrolase